jgi:hypothetical protein
LVLDAGGKELPRLLSRVRSGVANGNREAHGTEHFDAGVLGGGTLINQSQYWLHAYRVFRKRLGVVLPVFGTGVAAPELWSHHAGWVDRRREWAELIQDLPIIGVRGPLSKRLLIESGVRNVVVSGDPAVLFHSSLIGPGQPTRPCGPWRVGINFSSRGSIKAMHGDFSSVEQALTVFARELARAGHHVRLIPVYPADVEACRSLALRAGLAAVSVAPAATSAKGFLHHMESLDVMVALRLHASILAAAANVPPVILAYQPKCTDFSATIGWDRWTLRTSEVTAEKLLAAVEELQGDYTHLQLALNRAMSSLRMQFETYCSGIQAMWDGGDLEPIAVRLNAWERSAPFVRTLEPGP